MDPNNYKLEILMTVNETVNDSLKNSQLVISIIVKNAIIKIVKTNNETFVRDDKRLTYTINNFASIPRLHIGIIFETNEPDYVEVIKISYRYMVYC